MKEEQPIEDRELLPKVFRWGAWGGLGGSPDVLDPKGYEDFSSEDKRAYDLAIRHKDRFLSSQQVRSV